RLCLSLRSPLAPRLSALLSARFYDYQNDNRNQQQSRHLVEDAQPARRARALVVRELVLQPHQIEVVADQAAHQDKLGGEPELMQIVRVVREPPPQRGDAERDRAGGAY